MIHPLTELLETQTHQVRTEIEGLQGRLNVISGKLKQLFHREESFDRKLGALRLGQHSFQEQVKKIAEKLNQYKSLLASFHS